jgi:hypothetical protein
MTNDHSLGGTAVVAAGGLDHHVLPNMNAGSSKDLRVREHETTTALMAEEEKLMTEDEEITSEEDDEGGMMMMMDHDEEDNVERTMLTVALMKSVVESRGSADSNDNDDDDSSKHRYGLRDRKRRRPSGLDLERLENLQTSPSMGRKIKKDENDKIPSPPVISSEDAYDPPIIDGMLSVPNPLSKPIIQQQQHPPIGHRGKLVSTTSSVPCPLPAVVSASADVKKVTINEQHNEMSFNRKRGFSIDIDCKYLFRVLRRVCSYSFSMDGWIDC